MLGQVSALGAVPLGGTAPQGQRFLESDAGSFSWIGYDSDGLRRILTAEVGDFSWSGQDAASILQRAVLADAGSFVWIGQDAASILQRAVLADVRRILTAEVGNFSWSGQDAASIVWIGQDVDQSRARQRIRAYGGSSTAPGLSASSSGGQRLHMRTTRSC